ncbi:D-amino-acid transaminase [Roseomonas nepalensis]|uniref:Probable branched-chain-amino-acid aminotransferase n=1 Tax=Muricoccus nepalensis TaxID=1854500 RepID=A0A502FW04_9PROT|nr:D-amino-acid transaminase [Roseomonas nepalensis]TPG53123.1 D-amino-acid transaminase [Roseomonas nepalensis]
MSRIAYVNGRYVAQRDACVNIEDRGYQFGDGIYEVVHLYDGRFVDADLHLARLERSVREIRLDLPMPLAALRLVLAEVARRNRVTEGLLYMQVGRGVARRDHAFPKVPVPVSLVVTVRRIAPYPASLDGWSMSVITLPDFRWARRDIKSVNLLPNVLARQAAREAGAGEAILYDPATRLVAEGAATSFWIVDAEGTIRIPPLGEAILPGCTRAALLAEMAAAGLRAEERPFSLDDLATAREAFITSATSFVKPVLAVDGRPVGDGQPGPVTRRLFDLFARHVKGGPRNRAA